MKKLLIQALKFFAVSGVGWIVDFTIYTLLTYLFGVDIYLANIISSIPAVTWVFIFSTSKILKKKQSKVNIKIKYLIYLVYQLCLVVGISFIAQLLYNVLINPVTKWGVQFFIKYLKIIIKIFITPFTMILNFIVIKLIVEKL